MQLTTKFLHCNQISNMDRETEIKCTWRAWRVWMTCNSFSSRHVSIIICINHCKAPAQRGFMIFIVISLMLFVLYHLQWSLAIPLAFLLPQMSHLAAYAPLCQSLTRSLTDAWHCGFALPPNLPTYPPYSFYCRVVEVG